MDKSLGDITSEKHILVVPTYNCAQQVEKLFTGIIKENRAWSQIWFIDNRSTDQTVKVLRGLKSKASGIEKKIRIFVNDKNIGLGGTHKVAFKKAVNEGCQTITILHGDNQAKVVDAVKALRQYQESSVDFVLGSRFLGETELYGYSKARIIYNLGMNILLSFKLRKRIYDLGSGINVFSINEIEELNFDKLPNDLTFNIEFLKWLVKDKKKFQWCPIDWTEEDQISNVKVFRQLLKTMTLIFLPFGKFGDLLDDPPRMLESK
jgi:glycosyltransferase involved in cell wall biosynthesis